MPQFRYEGFADVLYRHEGDTKPVAKGAVGTFSQAEVDRLEKSDHRFTKVSDLDANEVEEAKNVQLNPALPESGETVDETRSVAPADAPRASRK